MYVCVPVYVYVIITNVQINIFSKCFALFLNLHSHRLNVR